MELIDRSGFREHLDSVYPFDELTQQRHDAYDIAKSALIRELAAFPAVDAEPVIHSHWEVAIGYDPNKKVACQNCSLMAYEPTMRCPHCGAHMDEEVDNGTFG